MSFKMGEGVDEGKRAWGSAREPELDDIPVDAIWTAALSEAGEKLQSVGAIGGEQRSYEGGKEAARNYSN